jgi:cytoskeleton protein RodZ
MVFDPDSAPAVDSRTSGQQLAAARAARGWSVREVAGRLRIRPALVEALERDDHAAFGAVTYARGQLRNYARLVGVDLPQALAGIGKPAVSAPGTFARRAPELHPRRPRLVRWGALAIAAVLLVLGTLWAREGRGPARSDEAQVALATVPGASVVAPVETASVPVDTAPTPAAPTPEVAAPPVAESAAPPPQPPATSDPSSPQPGDTTARVPATSVAEGNADIRIRSRAVSWVEVIDHTGKRLVYELVSPGPERVAHGAPPLRVLLGNAPAVELLYNGAPVDLPVGQHVVRLTLGAPPSTPAAIGALPAPAVPGAPTP